MNADKRRFPAPPISAVACVVMLLVCSAAGQQRFESGELKGFTRSSTEHIINELEEPFVVRSVEGQILDPAGYPMPGALFEIRGPESSERIRAAKTGKGGRFRIGSAPEGTYRFKATFSGFQSVIGTVIVKRTAAKKNRIGLTLKFGV